MSTKWGAGQLRKIEVGEKWRGKKIREVRLLSNDWYIIKTDNTKSARDFKVRTIFSLDPVRSMTPKHAHFAIDLYGKVCADKEKARIVLDSIIEIWHNKDVNEVLNKYQNKVKELPGYPLEYILFVLGWILEQEDINFTGRPQKKQKELDDICQKLNISVPKNRKGSQLAISVLCDIINEMHPVEALLKANLDVQPRRRYG
jgi:hypothetical protein